MRKSLIVPGFAPVCYFRTSIKPPHRKCLLQITERCNLRCPHCFVSATANGRDVSVEEVESTILPRLIDAHVIAITLTGGEPFVHSDIIQVARSCVNKGLRVGICTNGTCITTQQIEDLSKIDNVHINVSLDGFSSKSHGRFRGNLDAFETARRTIRALGDRHLLQGILTTPISIAQISEYQQICDFAIDCGAKYVLLNPLSPMGRGITSAQGMAPPLRSLEQIRDSLQIFKEQIDISPVRFPNSNGLPLGGCECGNIFYVFVNGDIAICPYLVFAAKGPKSRYLPETFIVGNVFTDREIDCLLGTPAHDLGSNNHCRQCPINSECHKGCPAGVVAAGATLDTYDIDLCPYH